MQIMTIMNTIRERRRKQITRIVTRMRNKYAICKRNMHIYRAILEK